MGMFGPGHVLPSDSIVGFEFRRYRRFHPDLVKKHYGRRGSRRRSSLERKWLTTRLNYAFNPLDAAGIVR